MGPNGTVNMVTEPLDAKTFIHDVLAREEEADRAVIGHVHLQVGDIPQARAFYEGVLGFDVTQEYGPRALFLSAGGYHHHIDLNNWRSPNAAPRAASLGLGTATIILPTRSDVEALSERVAGHGVKVKDDGRAIVVDDPWSTHLTFIGQDTM